MFKVTMESEDSVVTKQSDSQFADGWTIGAALKADNPPRICFAVAKIVEYFMDTGEWSDVLDHFDGYGDALDELCEAAKKIIAGWEDFDKRVMGRDT